jgi:hypothetical protein
MKINGLGFLSLFALLGFLAFVTGNNEFFGFFGFAYYVRYFFVTPDELFMKNLQSAATIGFFSGVVATGVGALMRVLLPGLLSATAVFASCFVFSFCCFTFALTAFELRETRGC